MFSGQPIGRYIGSSLPHTLILAWASLGLAVLLGIPLGVFSATHPGSWADRITAIISISFITLPSYVIGLFLLLLLAVQFRVMPAMGLGQSGNTGDYIRHLILPAIALAAGWVGYSGPARAGQRPRDPQRDIYPIGNGVGAYTNG